jgi:hypothetical protein
MYGAGVVDDPLETPVQGERLVGHAAPSESRSPRALTRHRATSDGLLLTELADLDELLRERGAVWNDLVRCVDGFRQEIDVASAQARRSRSLAARRTLWRDDAGQQVGPSGPTGDEARAVWLTHEFEAALRETEQRRVALHAEMDDLRRHGRALLGRLPASVSRAYLSLTERGCTPAVVAVANGACEGCEAPLPELVVEALSQGAVVVCARCERLLHPARPAE